LNYSILSRGFNLEDTHVADLQRFAKIVTSDWTSTKSIYLQ